MYSADYFIKNLNMTAHPEGGFFKEIYKSEENITSKELKVDFEDSSMLEKYPESEQIILKLTSEE